MSKNKERLNRDFQQLQIKIVTKTAILMLLAVIVIFGTYSFVLHGNFANAVVGFLDYFIYKNYEQALYVYQRIFRNYMDLFLLLGIMGVFLIVLKIYLKSFTQYFNEINKGIDALISENTEDVVLSPELVSIEKKINSIKHTLEQRKLEAEIAEQRKNDLVVYLAHDLKTPLTSVIGYLTLLRDENRISEELREKYLAISLEKAERLEELINEFFEITRFNLSNMVLEYRRVNLTRLLEQLVYEFQPMLSEKQLECVFESEPDIMLKCDADKMQRVFNNLLRNAVHYSFEKEKIFIKVLQGEKTLKIRFFNKGNTIPEEKLEHIFEQFYRLDTARSTKNGGAGLGLAIAKEIVELHGGKITAESENEEVVFEVELPI